LENLLLVTQQLQAKGNSPKKFTKGKDYTFGPSFLFPFFDIFKNAKSKIK